MKKTLFTFLLSILLLFPVVAFAALGDAGEPATSCTHIKDTLPSSGDGRYWLQTASMPAAKEYYCDMTTNGGGWMLLFQRRGGNFNNVETCGSGTNNFLHNSCGSVTNLSYGDSYIDDDIDTTLNHFGVSEYAVIQYNSSMIADTDDAYIAHTINNIFPNLTSATVIDVDSICHIDGTNCDNTDVDWVYAPHGWWNSNGCGNGWNNSTGLRGMYGPCHNGSSVSVSNPKYSVHSFNGNRDPSGFYSQTKLWLYNSASENFAERVFIRGQNPNPTDIILSNNSFDGTSSTPGIVGNFSTIDATPGDTHSYSFVGVYDNSNFSLSGSVLQILTVNNPSYSVNIRTTDASGNYFDKLFTINITGVSFPGSVGNPIISCQKLKNDYPSYPSGVYWMNNSNMATAREVYCNQNIAGGGWMLLFQRRGGFTNTESCGTNLNIFLHNDCGSPYALGYSDSYSLDVDRTFGEFGQNKYLVVQENASGVASSDAYIIDASNTLFPNNLGLSNINAQQICDINATNCDANNVKWKYTGKSWYASSRCNQNNYDSRNFYHGNYGYCQNGYGNYASSSLFGSRSGYAETKLWGLPASSANYMERVWVKNTIDTIDPIISSFSPAEDTIIPGKQLDIQINYADDNSGINVASISLVLQKWNHISATWGSDIKTASTDMETITLSGATYNMVDLDYGKYRYNFSVSDHTANAHSIERIFYMDEPSFEVSTSEVNIGNLNTVNEQYSPSVIITVQTVGAPFRVYIKRNTDLEYAGDIIPVWNVSDGYGYMPAPYSSPFQPLIFSPSSAIFSQGASINTNGQKNTYTYEFRLGGKVTIEQAAGDYEGSFDVEVEYDY